MFTYRLGINKILDILIMKTFLVFIFPFLFSKKIYNLTVQSINHRTYYKELLTVGYAELLKSLY